MTFVNGSVPTELGLLSQLKDLRWVPYESVPKSVASLLGQLTLLESLEYECWKNDTSPTEIFASSRLKFFSISGAVTGTIPTELAQLRRLKNLDFTGSYLNGTLPTELGNLSELTYLDLSDNELTGKIPTERGLLSALTHLSLTANALTGTIPAVFAQLAHLEIVDLSNQYLNGIGPSVGA